MTRSPKAAPARAITARFSPLQLLAATLLALALMAALGRGALAEQVADSAANPGQEAADFIRDFSDEALAMLSDESLDEQGRATAFRRLLKDGFHLKAIGRFVLGRHWRRASPSEKAEFAQLFEDYIVASYSEKLSAYGGERLTVGKGRKKGKSGAVVSSRVVPPEGASFQVEWRLRRTSDGWRIIDVVVEGVSMAVTQRSEFSSVIAGRGGTVGGLLEALRSRTESLEPPEAVATSGTEEAS